MRRRGSMSPSVRMLRQDSKSRSKSSASFAAILRRASSGQSYIMEDDEDKPDAKEESKVSTRRST